MTVAPSPRVAGIGPLRTDRPEWDACRERTPEESVVVFQAAINRALTKLAALSGIPTELLRKESA